MQGKQANMVSPTQERAILGYLVTTRSPACDRVLFLVSMQAGLRAKAMASLTWAMVTDVAGQVAEAMHVPNRASQGKTGGRTIPGGEHDTYSCATHMTMVRSQPHHEAVSVSAFYGQWDPQTLGGRLSHLYGSFP